ncbi:anti-sigma factor family protein [Portibacter lacus]|uniref:Uncharacterized protein n=1 Tax=Portibacter lacus TaxID=1099794 RepID=A0AA37WE91_9BACT|nr:sigma-E factor negative regulatory protein [Portibacter lacus]GLR17713.1 hypothetical protein GCM10007940_23280 [Portibacter lacus]
MTTDEKIQAYLDGELSGNSLVAFESELATNKMLKERYDNYLLARELSKGLLEIDMRETLENESRRSFSLSKWIWLIVALGVGALAIYFFSASSQGNNELFAEVYTEPIWPITRGSMDSLSSAIAEWKNSDDLDKATSQIKSINTLDLTTRNYWLTEVFLNAGERDSALFYLPSLSEDHIKYKRVQKIKTWIALPE